MRARYAIAASLLFVAPAVSAVDRLMPVALASTEAGMVVLNADGRILIADPKSGGGKREIYRNYDAVFDMAAGQWNGRTSIFVVGLADNRKLNVISEYSPEGKQLRTWTRLGGGPFYGIGLDSSSNTLYVTGGDSSIYSVTDTAFRLLASVTGISHIGSITVDSQHGRLFVATSDDGSVYTLDKAGHNQHRLAQGLGNVSALAYDNGGNTLYASDARGFVWKWNPDKQASPTKMTISVRLRQPLGLALAPGSSGGPDLLVGDQNANCVYRISAAGAMVQQIR